MAGCQGAGDASNEAPKRWRVGAAWSRLDTDILVDGRRVDMRENVVVAALERTVGKRAWVLGLSAGGIVEGSIRRAERRFTLEPGFIVGFYAGHQWLKPNRANLFLATTLSASFGLAWTRERLPGAPRERFIATDLRADVAFGATLFKVWSPYVAVRLLGGPIFWRLDNRRQQGSDPGHHTLAVGSRFDLPGGVDISLDWGFEGARTVTAGLGVRF